LLFLPRSGFVQQIVQPEVRKRPLVYSGVSDKS